MGELKRKQHYVFQAYLKAWCGSDDKLWVLRDKRKVYPAAVRSVLFEGDMYKLRPLNDDEKEYIRIFVKAAGTSETILQLVDKHINDTQTFFEDRKAVDAIRNIMSCRTDVDAEFERLNEVIQEGIVNTEEDFLGEYEGEGKAWISRLLSLDSEFFYSDEKIEFLNFLCIQYFRTQKIRQILKDNLAGSLDTAGREYTLDPDKMNVENVIPHVIWYLQAACANGLMERNAHLTILKNKTRIPFITADQPVINLRENHEKELVFYYPLSPDTAILVNDCNRRNVIEYDRGDAKKVAELNQKIIDSADKFIISNKKNVLEAIVDEEWM